MNNISLILPTYNPDLKMLSQALECSDLFDEVLLHVNGNELPPTFILPKNCKMFYQRERIPVQDALNWLIMMAEGQWILGWTDDDFFNRKELANLLLKIKNDEIQEDIIHFPIYAGNDIDKTWTIWGDNAHVRFRTLCKENYIPFSSIYRKDVWKKIQGYQAGIFNDWRFWIEAIKNKCTFYYWPEKIYFHRERHKETLANKEVKTFNKKEWLKEING